VTDNYRSKGMQNDNYPNGKQKNNRREIGESIKYTVYSPSSTGFDMRQVG
jgi:hypothetical protein